MHASPLQLEQYFVTDQRFSTNRKFDPKKPVELDFSDLGATSTCLQDKDNTRKWQVTLKLVFKPGPNKNVPYHFMTEIVGFFYVGAECPDDSVQFLATTNGPSVLFGAARESLRALMAQGPYIPFMIPTASFYEPKPKPEAVANTTTEPKKD